MAVSARIFSTSMIITNCLLASSATAVTKPPIRLISIGGGAFTLSQSSLSILSTECTRNPWTFLLYSVTIRILGPSSASTPQNVCRLITGTMDPRRLTIPSTLSGIFGAWVISGTCITSRTLNTLMPKTSSRPVALSFPRLNRRTSSLLVPASWVLSSTDWIKLAIV